MQSFVRRFIIRIRRRRSTTTSASILKRSNAMNNSEITRSKLDEDLKIDSCDAFDEDKSDCSTEEETKEVAVSV